MLYKYNSFLFLFLFYYRCDLNTDFLFLVVVETKCSLKLIYSLFNVLVVDVIMLFNLNVICYSLLIHSFQHGDLISAQPQPQWGGGRPGGSNDLTHGLRRAALQCPGMHGGTPGLAQVPESSPDIQGLHDKLSNFPERTAQTGLRQVCSQLNTDMVWSHRDICKLMGVTLLYGFLDY